MSKEANGRNSSKVKEWGQLIAEKERCGVSVKRFCHDWGVAEHLFYYWRKRVREQRQPVRFALVDRGRGDNKPSENAALELVLTNGERLRISDRVDASTLRMVLAAVRT